MDILARNWGWIALRGVAALVFGLLALLNPAAALMTLVILFGSFAIVDGVFAVISAITNRRGEPHWVALLLGGLAGVAIGGLTLLMPRVTVIVFLFFIAAWALATGAAQIVAGIRLRKLITGEWLLILGGVLSVLFGLLLIFSPAAGALAIALWVGVYAVVTGVVLLALALRLRSWGRQFGATAAPRPA